MSRENIERLRAVYSAWAEGNCRDVEGLYGPDVTFETMSDGRQVLGRDEIEPYKCAAFWPSGATFGARPRGSPTSARRSSSPSASAGWGGKAAARRSRRRCALDGPIASSLVRLSSDSAPELAEKRSGMVGCAAPIITICALQTTQGAKPNARSSDRRRRPQPDRARLQGVAGPASPGGDRRLRRRQAARAQPRRLARR